MSGVKDCGAKFGMIICAKFDFGPGFVALRNLRVEREKYLRVGKDRV